MHDEGRRNLSSFASFHAHEAAASDGSSACHIPKAVYKPSGRIVGREGGGGSCHRKQKKIVFSEKEWRLLLIHQDPSLCVISKLGYIMRLNLHPDAIHIPEPTTWWCSTVTNTIPTDRVSREAEKRHIKKALSKCGYLVSENKTTLLYYSVYYIL